MEQQQDDAPTNVIEGVFERGEAAPVPSASVLYVDAHYDMDQGKPLVGVRMEAPQVLMSVPEAMQMAGSIVATCMMAESNAFCIGFMRANGVEDANEAMGLVQNFRDNLIAQEQARQQQAQAEFMQQQLAWAQAQQQMEGQAEFMQQQLAWAQAQQQTEGQAEFMQQQLAWAQAQQQMEGQAGE